MNYVITNFTTYKLLLLRKTLRINYFVYKKCCVLILLHIKSNF
jgi:hypothetical protein